MAIIRKNHLMATTFTLMGIGFVLILGFAL